MTDFRFPDRWLQDRRIMSLSGDDFKTFVTVGAWMVTNRTDGYLDAEDLDYVPRLDRDALPRLIIAGLFTEHENGWLMLDYEPTQTSKAEFEVLERARKADRLKKARQRAARKNPGDGPGDGPGDMSPGTTQDRTGQDRQDQARDDSGRQGAQITEWPVAQIGVGRAS
jgi:hypothetical protein